MSFNPSQFMQAVYNDANSTAIKPAPEGDYVGVIQPLDEKSISGGTSSKGNEWARLDLQILVEGDPNIKAATGLDKKTIRAGVMLDLTPSGGLDFSEGRNVTLGRLRQAVGLNQPGAPFSFPALAGKLVKISVKHRVDPNDASKIYEDVKAFFPVA